MAKKVVIVESGAKAKTIAKYLGGAFVVKACRGHVRDLPRGTFGVEVENGFEPTYTTLPESRSIVGQLKKAAASAPEVYLAPDPDREGEAIAWHLRHVLELPAEKVRRVTFNEITRSAVRNAFERPREIDMNLVDAQQARRILDRIVGYELSPLVSRRIVRGLSAGRVQSVALRIVVERERERLAFVPEEYWELTALLTAEDGGPRFEAMLKELNGQDVRVGNGDEARALVERLSEEAFGVADVETRTTRSSAPPPFITSTLQQAAYSRLRFSTAQTMRLAQQLYEGIEVGGETAGLITYMRTDSTRVADAALGACRSFIGETHGDAYLPAKPNTFRSPRGAQAAHEAIRPTEVFRRPEDVKPFLSDRQYRLYDLIWRRFVASQMTPAQYEVTTARIQAGPAVFVARGRRMVFDGHTRVGGADKREDQELPALSRGDGLTLVELTPSQHFTQPPARYTEASLVRELEKQGIGRPSTYAPTISTLLKRNYVRRSQRALEPTDLGMTVTDLLVASFPREMDVGFTSRMEQELDEVEEGKRDWRATLQEFYEQFRKDLEKAKAGPAAHVAGDSPAPPACPECGETMGVKFSRKGDRFYGCPRFPECKGTASIPREGEPEPDLTEHACDKCGAPMIRRVGRRGREYLACSAYPQCRNIMGLDREGNPVKLPPRVQTTFACPKCGAEMHLPGEGDASELTCSRCKNTAPLLSIAEALEKTEIPDGESLGSCPECDGPMDLKKSRKGMFLGCRRYPECKGTSPLAKDTLPAPQPTHERCDKCGRPLLMRWGQYGRFLACSGFPRCRNLWKVPARGRKCPREGCDGRLIPKVDSDGHAYLGCTRYPECAHTEPAPEPAPKKGK